MTELQSIAIFGGTFDPPHIGHLNIALTLQNSFHFERFLFLPCKIPVLKKGAHASSDHRLKMLTLLLEKYPLLTISTKEIDRDSPSYMVETLGEFRKELGESVSITLIIGSDAYQELDKWHQASKLPLQCNLLVVERQSVKEQAGTQQQRRHSVFSVPCKSPLELTSSPHGKAFFMHAGDYPVSSSLIRNTIQQGKPITDYVPDNIRKYIQEHHLYDL